MHHPIALDKAYRRLRHTFITRPDARTRLEAICAFLDTLGDELSRFELYALELAGELATPYDDGSLFGTDPNELLRALHQLDRLPSVVHQLRDDPTFIQTLTCLRTDVALLFAYAGEPVMALRTLGGVLAGASGIEPDAPPLGARESYRRLVNDLAPEGYALRETLEALDGRWIPRHDGGRATEVTLPVVTRRHRVPSGADGPGLRRVETVVWTAPTGGGDRVRANVPVRQGDGSPAEGLEKAVQAARHELGTAPGHVLDVYVLFDRLPAPHEGSSANLAVALATMSRLCALRPLGAQLAVSPTAAFTGDVSATGDVLPVAEGTLSVKAQGAFFSWVTHLAVPRSQAAAVAEAVHHLQERYPRRSLDVVGVAHLREVLDDRRLVTRTRPSIGQMASHVGAHHKVALAGWLLAVALAAALAL